MSNRFRTRTAIVLGIYLFLGYCIPAPAQSYSHVSNIAPKETIVTTRASGTFEIELTSEAEDAPSEDSSLGRMSIEKQFHGDLEATSKGRMLTATTAIKGSAGYVAIELVTGTLHGRSGTFMLQHSGTMTGGAQKLTVTVVPDSGTGQLVGLAGEMTIKVSEGKHSYDFEYTLTPAP